MPLPRASESHIASASFTVPMVLDGGITWHEGGATRSKKEGVFCKGLCVLYGTCAGVLVMDVLRVRWWGYMQHCKSNGCESQEPPANREEQRVDSVDDRKS
jgi:hypothetical protein